MSKRHISPLHVPPSVNEATAFHLLPAALQAWDVTLALSGDKPTENVIEVLDVIGKDAFGEGVTAERIGFKIRAMSGPIDVLVNSPGGAVTEGIAIYNILAAYPDKVTMKIVGMAGSIASIIALAGDEIQIARTGFFMIHNSATIVGGDKYDMKFTAEWLDMVDETMRDVYHARSGIPVAEITAMMDRETRLRGSDAVAKGFADSLLASDSVVSQTKSHHEIEKPAAHKVDVLMARAGVPRAERRTLLTELRTGTPGAAEDDTPGAVVSSELSFLNEFRIS